MRPIILASNSPRRKEILTTAGISFTVEPANIEETIDENLSPIDVPVSLARQKARYIYERHPECLVIGADTIVLAEGYILGKPVDYRDAKQMLELLNGRKHSVITGIYMISKEKAKELSVVTEVEFAHMTDDEIEEYISTGDVFDKAGAYGIQGFAGRYIKGIKGDYFNVVGLPINALYEALKNFE
jgi:septum formation protein